MFGHGEKSCICDLFTVTEKNQYMKVRESEHLHCIWQYLMSNTLSCFKCVAMAFMDVSVMEVMYPIRKISKYLNTSVNVSMFTSLTCKQPLRSNSTKFLTLTRPWWVWEVCSSFFFITSYSFSLPRYLAFVRVFKFVLNPLPIVNKTFSKITIFEGKKNKNYFIPQYY